MDSRFEVQLGPLSSLPSERCGDNGEIQTTNLKIGICAVLTSRLPGDGKTASGGDRTGNNYRT
jgi:hypothetical protein